MARRGASLVRGWGSARLARGHVAQEHVVKAFGDKFFKAVVAALDILHQALRSDSEPCRF